MKSIKEYCHTLHVLKHARPKLRKAIISNCDRDLVNCISERVLNVLNGNFALTGFEKRKIIKHNIGLRSSLIDKYRYKKKKRLIVQSVGSTYRSWPQSYPHLLVSLLPSNACHFT